MKARLGRNLAVGAMEEGLGDMAKIEGGAGEDTEVDTWVREMGRQHPEAASAVLEDEGSSQRQ